MNIWNKVFLGIIIITAITVVVLASIERKIRGTGQKTVDTLAKKIDETDGKITKIVSGTAPTKLSVDKSPSEWGLNELRGITRERFNERGRAWFGCIVRGVNEITLPPALFQVEAQIIITSPFLANETGVATDVIVPDQLRGIVYAFEEGEAHNAVAFLGRFRVTSDAPTPTKFSDNENNEKNGYQITLTTADPISDQEIDQILDASKSRWALYLTPPVDRVARLIDQLSDEEKQAIPEELRQPRPMPELTPEEKEGQDPKVVEAWEQYRKTMDDPESALGRDLAAALNWYYEQRSSLNRHIEIAQSDIATYKAAEEKNQIENEKLEGDCVREEKRVEAMNVQRDHVKTLLEQYEAEVNKITLQIEKLQAMGAAYAAKIAEYQLKAVEKIEAQANSPK